MENCNCVKSAVGAVTSGLLEAGHEESDIYSALLASAALVCVQYRERIGIEKSGKKDFKMHAAKAYEEMQLINDLIKV